MYEFLYNRKKGKMDFMKTDYIILTFSTNENKCKDKNRIDREKKQKNRRLLFRLLTLLITWIPSSPTSRVKGLKTRSLLSIYLFSESHYTLRKISLDCISLYVWVQFFYGSQSHLTNITEGYR